MKDFVFFQLSDVSKDDYVVRYFDSLEVLKHCLFSAIDGFIDADPNAILTISFPSSNKSISFEIRRLDISVSSLSDLI